MRNWIILAAGAWLAACSPDAAQETAAPAEPIPAVAPEPADAPLVVNLQGEGLSLVDTNTGRATPIAFGAERAAVERVVALSRGDAVETGANPECGAGPLDFATYPGGLQLWFQDGRFVGWGLQPDAAGDLTTASGLGVGSSRAGLESAYDATVEETSLGHEFQAGGLSGLLAATGPDAKVTALWAGTACVFR